MKQKKFLALMLCIGSLNGILASQKGQKKQKQKFTVYGQTTQTFVPTTPSQPIAIAQQPNSLRHSSAHSSPFSSSIGLSALMSTSPKSRLTRTSSTQQTSTSPVNFYLEKTHSIDLKSPSDDDDNEEDATSALPHLEDLMPKFKKLGATAHSNLNLIKDTIVSINEYKTGIKQCILEEDLYSSENDLLLNKHRIELEATLNEEKATLSEYKATEERELTEEEQRHQQVLIALRHKFKQLSLECGVKFASEAELLQAKIQVIELEQKRLKTATENAQGLLKEQEETKKFLTHDTNTQLDLLDKEINTLHQQISTSFSSENLDDKKELYENLISTNREQLKELSEKLTALTPSIQAIEEQIEETIPTFPEATAITQASSALQETSTEVATHRETNATQTDVSKSYWLINGII